MKTRTPKTIKRIVGLDLSLTGPAAAALPKGWSGRPREVLTETWPQRSSEGKPERWDRISNAVLTFVESIQPEAVFVEDYAFSAKSSSVTKLAELGGIVRRDLWRANPRWMPIEVKASQARKHMLGRGGGEGIKEWVQANVRGLKGEAVYWTGDQIDAIVVCNFGANLLEWSSIAFDGKDV